jgi:hypothetical protein
MVNNEDLIAEALIAAFMVLETSGNSDIDPDVAVRGMENIAYSLLRMDPAGQAALRARFVAIGQASDDAPYRSFAMTLPDMIGLRETP